MDERTLNIVIIVAVVVGGTLALAGSGFARTRRETPSPDSRDELASSSDDSDPDLELLEARYRRRRIFTGAVISAIGLALTIWSTTRVVDVIRHPNLVGNTFRGVQDESRLVPFVVYVVVGLAFVAAGLRVARRKTMMSRGLEPPEGQPHDNPPDDSGA